MRTGAILRVLFPILLATLLASACAAEKRNSPSAARDGGGAVATDEDAGLVSGDFADGSAPQNEVVATLRGSVRAPNPQYPISGALVYLTDEIPEARPEGVHCDECVTLTEDTPYALSDPDGHFELPSYKLGDRYLVVQKGGFRRVRPITIEEGDQDVPRTLTTLPPQKDAQKNDDVPKMAVVKATFDEIESSLEELGLTGGADSFTLMPDAASFLRNAKQMNEYEIIFIPCGTDYDLATDPTIIKNLKAFVEAGGRVYATDWHYDFVHQTWPGYIQWQDQSNTPCSGCSTDEYDAPAKAEDQGLADWLKAQNITSFDIEGNWTRILHVNALPGKDKDGNAVTITPKVWVKATETGQPTRPNTVSFEQGCGRVLFSTYHTEQGSQTMPQELALLYVLLEVSVCTESPEGVIVK
jgi:hypothetical protein